MQNQENKFTVLIEHASSCLGKSEEEIKDKYKDFPICLIEYIENKVYEHVIEIRFDNLEATISLSFDKQNNCDSGFLFFDTTQEEESFIDYLAESVDYSFRKSSWRFPGCHLKIRELKDSVSFYLYK